MTFETFYYFNSAVEISIIHSPLYSPRNPSDDFVSPSITMIINTS